MWIKKSTYQKLKETFCAVKRIEKDIWELKNKPKFKVGDKVIYRGKEYIINRFFVRRLTNIEAHVNNMERINKDNLFGKSDIIIRDCLIENGGETFNQVNEDLLIAAL